MNDDVSLITVNTKKEYHNCEMTFCFYYNNDESDFKVNKDQKYKIYTTVKEVTLLNEALNVYQEEGFKDTYLLYSAETDGSQKYPAFVGDYIDAVQLGKALQALANDEDSLVQLSEYCIEIPPTYADDFGINKQIESIRIDSEKRDVSGYEDLKDYLSELREERPSLFA